MLLNDIDLDGDMIYFIDSSSKNNVNNAVLDILESFPLGRLFSFNEKSNELKLVKSQLYFPNGLQILPNKEAILVNECSAATITK
jgi:sugar lactone lactonase YvrE